MKKNIIFTIYLLACLLPAGYSISCNSVEGNVEDTMHHITTTGKHDTDHAAYIYAEADSVLICNSKTSYAFHKGYCGGLKRCKASVKKILKSDAEALGKKACGYCY